MKTQKRRLMWHGMLLFLLGLITGLLEQRFTNVRMGLSAPQQLLQSLQPATAVSHGKRTLSQWDFSP